MKKLILTICVVLLNLLSFGEEYHHWLSPPPEVAEVVTCEDEHAKKCEKHTNEHDGGHVTDKPPGKSASPQHESKTEEETEETEDEDWESKNIEPQTNEELYKEYYQA